jgi:hypothetical protein
MCGLAATSTGRASAAWYEGTRPSTFAEAIELDILAGPLNLPGLKRGEALSRTSSARRHHPQPTRVSRQGHAPTAPATGSARLANTIDFNQTGASLNLEGWGEREWLDLKLWYLKPRDVWGTAPDWLGQPPRSGVFEGAIAEEIGSLVIKTRHHQGSAWDQGELDASEARDRSGEMYFMHNAGAPLPETCETPGTSPSRNDDRGSGATYEPDELDPLDTLAREFFWKHVFSEVNDQRAGHAPMDHTDRVDHAGNATHASHDPSGTLAQATLAQSTLAHDAFDADLCIAIELAVQMVSGSGPEECVVGGDGELVALDHAAGEAELLLLADLCDRGLELAGEPDVVAPDFGGVCPDR